MVYFTAPVFDIMIGALFIVAAISGYIKGFIKQAIGLLALLLGIYLARRFTTTLSSLLEDRFVSSDQGFEMAIFIALFIGLTVSAIWLTRALSTLINFAMLSWLNHLLGTGMACLQVVLSLAVLYYIVLKLNIDLNQYFSDLDQSFFLPLIKGYTPKLFQVIENSWT